ncbi:hypothetical protein R1flu_005874 [Riccia fluitans]|uniref:Uncharacterized protein n=1 Tax=Riccia fluitans TaxID=41844 RepID=A0ABD1YUM7_9MARC
MLSSILEAASEAKENVQHFEPAIDNAEDVEKLEEEDTLNPFWANLISRVNTFDTSASREERIPRYREMLWKPKPP